MEPRKYWCGNYPIHPNPIIMFRTYLNYIYTRTIFIYYSQCPCFFKCTRLNAIGLGPWLICCGIWPDSTDMNGYDICSSQICTCWSQYKMHVWRTCDWIAFCCCTQKADLAHSGWDFPYSWSWIDDQSRWLYKQSSLIQTMNNSNRYSIIAHQF